MRDPYEGRNADGTIRTGVDRARVPAAFEPVLHDLVDEFARLDEPVAELHLYGSVATGTARPGRSDVDLLVIDATPGWAAEVGARLSRRHAPVCRGVEIASARGDDYVGSGDESYGNRVFLRHYCVWLAGSNAVCSRVPFAGDRRAARGFNGDILQHLARWRAGGVPAQRVARKTLVAAAGIVSVRTGGWTTDRAAAVEAWSRVAAVETAAMHRLLQWADGTHVPAEAELAAAVRDGGIVHCVASRFVREIGAWTAPTAST